MPSVLAKTHFFLSYEKKTFYLLRIIYVAFKNRNFATEIAALLSAGPESQLFVDQKR